MSLCHIDHSISNYSTHIVQNLNNKVISYHKEPYNDMITSQQTLQNDTNQ